jgi:hypothetical protein
VPGVALVSLQQGAGAEQRARAPFPVRSLPGRDADGGALLDTAAVMTCLGLVVTLDSAVAHLAGALAVPVWVALPHRPDWRWFLDREDTPWYPTMRLWRQDRPGAWAPVFARMGAELARVVAGMAPAIPRRAAAPPGEGSPCRRRCSACEPRRERRWQGSGPPRRTITGARRS